MSSLISLPFRATEDLDLGAAIEKIINEEYYQTTNTFKEDIELLKKLRSKIYLNITNDIINPFLNEEVIETFKQYFVHLSSLSLKFPTDFAEFSWSDGNLSVGYTGNSKEFIRLKSLLFEQINILYNLAVIYCQLGNFENSKNHDEGLKKASHYFQLSSGIFEILIRILIKNESFWNYLSKDFQLESLNFLNKLMLGQAQEMFLLKAVKDNLKDSLIAKLSSQISVYYDESLKFLEKNHNNLLLRNDWLNQLKVKIYYFKAISQYRQSKFCANENKFGEEVARLKLANQLTNQMKSYEKYIINNDLLKKNCENLSIFLKKQLKISNNDNDLIYLQIIPEINDLKEIAPISMVKSIIIDELENPLKYLIMNEKQVNESKKIGKLLFYDLLPYSIIQLSQSFREKQENYVKENIINPINNLNKQLDEFLLTNKLSTLVNLNNNDNKLSEELLKKIEKIKKLQGNKKILETLNDIKKLSKNDELSINSMRSKLLIESKEDELLRNRYGTMSWNRPKSEEINDNYEILIDELESLMLQAKQGDGIILNNFQEIKNQIEFITVSNVEDIEKQIPNSRNNNNDNDFLGKIIEEIKINLMEIDNLKINRSKFVEIIEIKSSQMNILPKIINEYKYLQNSGKLFNTDKETIDSYYQDIFNSHIKGFQDIFNSLNEERVKQEEIIKKLKIHLKNFENFENPKNDSKIEFFNNLELICSSYFEIIDNLKQGINFYNDFLIKINETCDKIDEFLNDRRNEAKLLEIKINQMFLNNNNDNDNNNYNIVSPKPKKKNQLWTNDKDLKFTN